MAYDSGDEYWLQKNQQQSAPAPTPAASPAPSPATGVAASPAPTPTTGIINSQVSAPKPPAPAPVQYTAPAYAAMAQDNSVQDIQQSYAQLTALGSQDALDRYLATTPYTAAQLSAALPQYSESALQNVINAARQKYPNQQQFAPSQKLDFGGGYTQNMGGNPSTYNTLSPTSLNNYHMAQIGGYRGTYEEWVATYNQRQQQQYEAAQKDAAANPTVVVGGSTGPASANIVQPRPVTPPTPPASQPPVIPPTPTTTNPPVSPPTTSGGGTPTTTNPGGIVNNAVNNGQFSEWNVTPAQTVRQQASEIIAADGSLMQQARGRAIQQMNERGLINSSMGIQAAQDAVMERALQIAAPDAATNAQAAQFNANQGNAWNLAQSEMAQRGQQFAAELDQRGQQFYAELAQRDQQFAAESEYKRWSLMQNFENQKQLQEIESKYSEQLNSDANFQKQYSMYLDALFQIDMNPDLDPETKLQMKRQRGQELDDYVAINNLGIDMDFSDYWESKMTAAPAPAPSAAPAPSNPFGDNSMFTDRP